MRSEVRYVEVALALAADEQLQLDGVKEAYPIHPDHVLEAAEEGLALHLDLHTPAYVSIRQHTWSAYVSGRQHKWYHMRLH